jgi:hypothetical protein
VIAERDVRRHCDLRGHRAVRAGLEWKAMDLAEQLDLAGFVGRHPVSGHQDVSARDDGGGIERQPRRLGSDGGANTEDEQQDEHQDGGARDLQGPAAPFGGVWLR